MLRRLDSTIKPLWSPRRLVGLALLLGLMLGGLVLLGTYTFHQSTAQCHTVARLEVVIQEQGQRTLKTLGRPNGIGYAYYSTHPTELRIARAQLEQQVRDFTPSKCPGIF